MLEKTSSGDINQTQNTSQQQYVWEQLTHSLLSNGPVDGKH